MADFTTHFDIPYANATDPRHALDLYIPPSTSPSTPLFVWIHGVLRLLRQPAVLPD